MAKPSNWETGRQSGIRNQEKTLNSEYLQCALCRALFRTQSSDMNMHCSRVYFWTAMWMYLRKTRTKWLHYWGKTADSPILSQKACRLQKSINSHVSVAYRMCSPLHVLMKSWTWENNVSKSGMLGMENFTNLKLQKITSIVQQATAQRN